MTPQGILLLLLAVLVVGVVGVAAWARGNAQRADFARRSRLEADVDRRRAAAADGAERALRRLAPFRRLEDRLLAVGHRGRACSTRSASRVAVAAVAYLVGALVISRTGRDGPRDRGGCSACDRYLAVRCNRRVEEFVAQLPELARTLSNASSAGLALSSAVALAARELAEPAKGVLQGVVDELALGQSIDGALHNLGRRMPSREVAVLVTTLVIQQRAGGDTVSALRDMSETLERRKDLRREIKTILAGALATGYTVAALGVGTLVFMNLISPGIVARMLDGWLGRIVLLRLRCRSSRSGSSLIRRITRIES